MELRHLKYFKAVAEALNFTKAAARLHVAQPALSRQIADLEYELGVDLLKRASYYLVATDDKMIPPPAQRAMAERARAVVTEVAGSHAVYVSKPGEVAKAVQRAAVAIG